MQVTKDTITKPEIKTKLQALKSLQFATNAKIYIHIAVW